MELAKIQLNHNYKMLISMMKMLKKLSKKQMDKMLITPWIVSC